MGNRVFWIGILLGALLAIALIWNPGGPPPRRLDDAPTWSGQRESQHNLGAVSNHAAHDDATTDRAAPRPPVSSSQARAPDHPPHYAPPSWPNADAVQAIGDQPEVNPNGQGDLDAPPPGRESAPSFDEWTGGAPGPPAARTARSHETHWDGAASPAGPNGQSHMPPGEATPTGIVNPW
jgi:hypothetical protein